MKTRVYHLYCAVLSALLSVLGFTSCSKDTMGEYGSPNADYRIEGNVTDENGNPITGILVSADYYEERQNGKYWYNLASKKTNYGKYSLNFNTFPEFRWLKLVVQDVDGEDNGGEFANDTIDIDYKSAVQTKEGERWYSGAYRIIQDIKLKKK